MYNIQDVFNNCKEMLDDLNIEYGYVYDVSPNTTSKKRWGQCHKTFLGYAIEINIGLLNEKEPIEALETTMLHELLHTVAGCMNHGAEWKRLADIVNRAYGYNIKRCSSAGEKGVSDGICYSREQYHYFITCNKCGRVFKYKRNCETVQCCQKNRATCCCGGKSFTVRSV